MAKKVLIRKKKRRAYTVREDSFFFLMLFLVFSLLLLLLFFIFLPISEWQGIKIPKEFEFVCVACDHCCVEKKIVSGFLFQNRFLCSAPLCHQSCCYCLTALLMHDCGLMISYNRSGNDMGKSLTDHISSNRIIQFYSFLIVLLIIIFFYKNMRF